MITTKLRNRIQGVRHKSAAGFTMVEVVIAGVMLVSVMIAVAQMSVSALAGSRNLSTRKEEAAVFYPAAAGRFLSRWTDRPQRASQCLPGSHQSFDLVLEWSS